VTCLRQTGITRLLYDSARQRAAGALIPRGGQAQGIRCRTADGTDCFTLRFPLGSFSYARMTLPTKRR
ncbi:hypothetical protein, partial [Enterobacter hormaechei]|uniref:hypothetical protein n=1 Tax=Enterobacter hormaechei TaxID=158836 RepID=UPI001F36FD1D